MTDALNRGRARTAAASDAPEDQARVLADRLRAGTLSRERLDLAAWLGHPAARIAAKPPPAQRTRGRLCMCGSGEEDSEHGDAGVEYYTHNFVHACTYVAPGETDEGRTCSCAVTTETVEREAPQWATPTSLESVRRWGDQILRQWGYDVAAKTVLIAARAVHQRTDWCPCEKSLGGCRVCHHHVPRVLDAAQKFIETIGREDGERREAHRAWYDATQEALGGVPPHVIRQASTGRPTRTWLLWVPHPDSARISTDLVNTFLSPGTRLGSGFMEGPSGHILFVQETLAAWALR